jgi:hypothetical protein
VTAAKLLGGGATLEECLEGLIEIKEEANERLRVAMVEVEKMLHNGSTTRRITHHSDGRAGCWGEGWFCIG